MTSNIGSPLLIENVSDSGEIAEPVRERVLAEMRAHFRPEFLNRVDEVVLFKPLTLAEIKKIVDLQLTLLRRRLADRHIELDLTDAAKEHVARAAYDPVYGARPLKRFLQRAVETPLSRKLIAGEISDNSRVLVDFKKGELAFETKVAKK
jgi:ATP-dependent Clp protease ATP-binding subunit ClpB